MLIFEHAVKYGGKFYPPNTPIEEAVQKAAETARKAELAKVDKEVTPEPEPARKAAKSRRKGDA